MDVNGARNRCGRLDSQAPARAESKKPGACGAGLFGMSRVGA